MMEAVKAKKRRKKEVEERSMMLTRKKVGLQEGTKIEEGGCNQPDHTSRQSLDTRNLTASCRGTAPSTACRLGRSASKKVACLAVVASATEFPQLDPSRP